jgi:hypothetical protein
MAAFLTAVALVEATGVAEFVADDKQPVAVVELYLEAGAASCHDISKAPVAPLYILL